MSIKQAFTLIELLVVIAIIGILSGLIVVSMNGITQKATIAKSQAFSDSLKNSLMMNMVGEWKLDEGSGTVANDTWTKINNGTLTDFTDTTAGYGDSATNTSGWMSSSNCISGTCLEFDGSSTYVDCGSSSTLNLTSALTNEAWIKPRAISGSQDIISKVGSYVLELQPAGRIAMALRTDEGWHFTLQGNTVLSANKWYHVVSTYDSATHTFKVYVNGVLDLTDTTSSNGLIVANSNILTLGYYNSSFPNRFGGVMDEVRVYKSIIPVSLVEEHYFTGLNNLLLNGRITKEEYLSRINEMGYEY